MLQTAMIRRLFLMFLYSAWTAGGATGCPTKCGNLTVPYPFGIGANSSCSLNPLFAINCDESFNPPKAFLTTNHLEVISISDTTIRIKNRLAASCYDQSGNMADEFEFSMNLSSPPYSFSNENMLTVVGCDDSAFLSRDADDDDDYEPDLISSCVAICSKPGELRDGICSGIGCCQSSIPEGLLSAFIDMGTDKGHAKVQNFSSCGYSFLAEKSSYSFNISDVSDSAFVSRIIETVPVVIDWAIGNQTCRETESLVCQPNSVCVDSGSILGGYHCSFKAPSTAPALLITRATAQNTAPAASLCRRRQKLPSLQVHLQAWEYFYYYLSAFGHTKS